MDDYWSCRAYTAKSLSEETEDESPMVYKPKDEIIENINDTVSIVNVIKPVYNFKSYGMTWITPKTGWTGSDNYNYPLADVSHLSEKRRRTC